LSATSLASLTDRCVSFQEKIVPKTTGLRGHLKEMILNQISATDLCETKLANLRLECRCMACNDQTSVYLSPTIGISVISHYRLW